MSKFALLAAISIVFTGPALAQHLAGAPGEASDAPAACRSEMRQQVEAGVRVTRFVPVDCEAVQADETAGNQTVDVETNVTVRVERRDTYRERYSELSTSPYILGSPRPRGY